MPAKIGKFLRIFFGCHARPERSFFFRGKQFPICARCTGELIGMIAGIPIAIFVGVPTWYIMILMMVPMLFDGFLQLLTPYESGNIRRLLTGILFGIAFIYALIYFHRFCVWVAGQIWLHLGADPEQLEKVLDAWT